MGLYRRAALLLIALALALDASEANAETASGAVCRPSGDCLAACRAQALELLQECRASGESRRECRERARALRAACLESACVPRPTCVDACERQAAAELWKCLAGGDDLPTCEEEAQEARSRCVFGDCGCEPLICTRACPDGFAKDANGCLLCECAPPRPPEPCFCPHVFRQVCGADGKTYGNACEADCAGVEVVHEGPCRTQCTPVVCQLFCEHGFAKDEHGCEICHCAPPPRR